MIGNLLKQNKFYRMKQWARCNFVKMVLENVVFSHNLLRKPNLFPFQLQSTGYFVDLLLYRYAAAIACGIGCYMSSHKKSKIISIIDNRCQ